MKSLWLSGLASAALLILAGAALAAEMPEACNSYKPAVTGGPMPPPESDIVVIRWLGNANFEFAHKGKVYLFDAYFDRTPRAHKVGFTAADVLKAEAIFVSHAHFDHISDIGTVARQTGAPVVGAPITAETAKARRARKTDRRCKGRRDHEVRRRDGRDRVGATFHDPARPYRHLREPLPERFAALFGGGKEGACARAVARHLRPQGDHRGHACLRARVPLGLQGRAHRQRGTDHAGVRALAEKLGPVDVAIVAYQVHAVADTQIAYTWPFIDLFKPKLFLPAHHDARSADVGRSRPRATVRQDPREHAEHGLPRTALSFADLRGRRRRGQGQGRGVQALSLPLGRRPELDFARATPGSYTLI